MGDYCVYMFINHLSELLLQLILVELDTVLQKRGNSISLI